MATPKYAKFKLCKNGDGDPVMKGRAVCQKCYNKSQLVGRVANKRMDAIEADLVTFHDWIKVIEAMQINNDELTARIEQLEMRLEENRRTETEILNSKSVESKPVILVPYAAPKTQSAITPSI